MSAHSDTDFPGQSATGPAEPASELDHIAAKRVVQALLFASDQPLGLQDLAEHLPDGVNIQAVIDDIRADITGWGFELVDVAGGYMFRTATDLAFLLRREVQQPARLSRAAVETLAIIAYHQPVSRAEIESIRGVSISRGTLDVLMEAGWIKLAGRRRTPGRPVTYGTTDSFLTHFGLASVKDLPGLADLRAAGLLDSVDTAFEQQIAADGDPDTVQIDIEDAIEQQENRETGNEVSGDANGGDVLDNA